MRVELGAQPADEGVDGVLADHGAVGPGRGDHRAAAHHLAGREVMAASIRNSVGVSSDLAARGAHRVGDGVEDQAGGRRRRGPAPRRARASRRASSSLTSNGLTRSRRRRRRTRRAGRAVAPRAVRKSTGACCPADLQGLAHVAAVGVGQADVHDRSTSSARVGAEERAGPRRRRGPATTLVTGDRSACASTRRIAGSSSQTPTLSTGSPAGRRQPSAATAVLPGGPRAPESPTR